MQQQSWLAAHGGRAASVEQLPAAASRCLRPCLTAVSISAVQTACVIVVAYACMDMRELALPGGFLLLLLSAAAQLPFFIYLCSYLEGDTSITLQVGLG